MITCIFGTSVSASAGSKWDLGTVYNISDSAKVTVTVYNNGEVLLYLGGTIYPIASINYNLTYSPDDNFVNGNDYSVTVTAKTRNEFNLRGSKTVTFTYDSTAVSPINLADAGITMTAGTTDIKSVYVGDKKLTEGVDFSVSYFDENDTALDGKPTDPGEYWAMITSKGTGTIGFKNEHFTLPANETELAAIKLEEYFEGVSIYLYTSLYAAKLNAEIANDTAAAQKITSAYNNLYSTAMAATMTILSRSDMTLESINTAKSEAVNAYNAAKALESDKTCKKYFKSVTSRTYKELNKKFSEASNYSNTTLAAAMINAADDTAALKAINAVSGELSATLLILEEAIYEIELTTEVISYFYYNIDSLLAKAKALAADSAYKKYFTASKAITYADYIALENEASFYIESIVRNIEKSVKNDPDAYQKLMTRMLSLSTTIHSLSVNAINENDPPETIANAYITIFRVYSELKDIETDEDLAPYYAELKASCYERLDALSGDFEAFMTYYMEAVKKANAANDETAVTAMASIFDSESLKRLNINGTEDFGKLLRDTTKDSPLVKIAMAGYAVTAVYDAAKQMQENSYCKEYFDAVNEGVNPVDISNAVVTLADNSGKIISVKLNGKELCSAWYQAYYHDSAKKPLDRYYEAPTAPGNYYVQILSDETHYIASSDFIPFTIKVDPSKLIDLSNATIEVTPNYYVDIYVSANGNFISPSNYTYVFYDSKGEIVNYPVKTGTYKVVIYGDEIKTIGKAEKTFSYEDQRADLKDAVIDLANNSARITSITLNGQRVDSLNYEMKYFDSENQEIQGIPYEAGTYKVVITIAEENNPALKGSAEKTFTITGTQTPIDISSFRVSYEDDKPILYNDFQTLTEGVDYTVSRTPEGDFTVGNEYTYTFTGKGAFTGTKTYIFTYRINISDAVITLADNSADVVSVTLNGKPLTAGVEYYDDISYRLLFGGGIVKPTNPGKYEVALFGNYPNGYSGEATKEFTIEPPKVNVTKLTLGKTKLELEAGKTASLTVTSILPTSADDKTVVWSSSDSNVAKVDSKTGVITAVSAGTATITATATNGTTSDKDDVSAKCKVTVTEAETTTDDDTPTDNKPSTYTPSTSSTTTTTTTTTGSTEKADEKEQQPAKTVPTLTANVINSKNKKVTSSLIKKAIEAAENNLATISVTRKTAAVTKTALKEMIKSDTTVEFNAGSYSITINPEDINKKNVKALDLGMSLFPKVQKVNGTKVPAGSVAIKPDQKGSFGCKLSVTLSADTVKNLDLSNLRLYKIDSKGKATLVKNAFTVNSDGTVTIKISKYSIYVLTDQAISNKSTTSQK